MGTSLIASLATHRSISCYVASLLAPKSHSSCREQNASFIARSSSFAYANNGFRSSARWPRSSGLWPCSEAGNPHPLRSTLIDVCNGVARCRDSRSPSEVPYHCHMQEKQHNPPRHKKYLTKIPTYWKMSQYPLIKEGQLSHKYAFLRASGETLLRLGASLKRVNGAIILENVLG